MLRRGLLVQCAFGLALLLALWQLSQHAFGQHSSSTAGSATLGGPAGQMLGSATQLDHSLSVPGVRGLIEGVTGTGQSHMLPAQAGSPYGMIVTDFPLRVDRFFGSRSSPYSIGSFITLRVPGGTEAVAGPSKRLSMSTDSGPSVAAGQHLFVFVRDQGTVAGGNTGRILVASDGTDVFVVSAIDGLVHGQGGWASVIETPEAFRKHFQG